MKRGSTIILRGVIILIGLVVLVLCTYALPGMIASEIKSRDFDFGWIFVGMYAPAIPFFFALFQGWKLLGLIDKGQAFSQSSVKALGYIKYCGAIISMLYALGMPYVFYIAEKDDAPGLVAIGFIIIFASFIIAIAAAVIQRLFHNAIAIKSENDLTV